LRNAEPTTMGNSGAREFLGHLRGEFAATLVCIAGDAFAGDVIDKSAAAPDDGFDPVFRVVGATR